MPRYRIRFKVVTGASATVVDRLSEDFRALNAGNARKRFRAFSKQAECQLRNYMDEVTAPYSLWKLNLAGKPTRKIQV
ncbi:MAG: hypothetical protein Q7R67_01570 [bacterium]|nr:hypothetical protein [bacterium]